MVTALALKHDRQINRIGILDFDQHYGDGTADIINKLGLGWVIHYTAGDHYDSPSQSTAFLRAIPGIVRRMADCDLLLYQAGADPHVDDPLGGWLTTEQLRERDRLVFETAKAMALPIAWNLAGGYQQPLQKVLDIHDNTMRECVRTFATGP